MEPTARSRYSSTAIAFHWTIAVLMIGNLAGGLLHESFGEAAEGAIIGLHKAIGVLVLVLSLARLAWRLGHRPPPLAATLKRWEIGLAHAVHWTFYVLMIALPLSGWLMVSAGQRKWPISFFGMFDVPFLPVNQDKAIGGLMHEAHEILGFFTIALIILHVLAAIKHHVFDGDNSVERMLPLLRSKGRI
jgi:cytochrome b561